MSANMECRGWLLFVTGSTLMAILQVDCIVREHENYEFHNISHAESFVVPENVTDVPRSTVITMHADKKVISTESTPELSTMIGETRSETSHSRSVSGNGGESTQPNFLNEDVTEDSSIDKNSSGTAATDRQIKITHLPVGLNTEEKESTSNSDATSTHSSTLNNVVLVTNSSVTFTPEIADNTLFDIRESSTQYLGNKSSANDNDSTSRPLSASENFRNISSSIGNIDNTYGVTNSELNSEPIAFSTSSSSLRDVSQPEETISSNMISTVPLSEYRQSARPRWPTHTSEMITNFSNSTVTPGISTEELTSHNEIIPSIYTVSSSYTTNSHVEGSKNESFHGSFTTQQHSARVQCNHSSDCLENEVCMKSYDGKSYCDCHQNFVRDNISGACLADSSNSHFQLQESTGVTSAPSADTTGFISRSITTDFPQTVNTFVTIDGMNLTVPDQVKNVENSKLSSRDSNGQSATLNYGENLGTKIMNPYDSSTTPSMSYQEETSREIGSTLETTDNSFNTSFHNQEKNIEKSYTLSNTTHIKPRTAEEDTSFTEKSVAMTTPSSGENIEKNDTESNAALNKPNTTDEDIIISSSFTGKSVSITTPSNGDANERQTTSTNVPTQGVVFDVKGKANCSSQTIQSKQFNLKSWNNLTSVEHSINVLGIQLRSTLDMVEWFHSYDYPFRTFIANVLAEENEHAYFDPENLTLYEEISQNTEDRVNGAQNVIYIAPTPLTDGQRISICFVVASVNKLGHYLNASDAVKLILKERDILDKEVHLQISSASVGCPSEYRENYIKCKIAHVPPLAVAVSIIVAMVVLVLILIVLLYVRRHKHHRRSYTPRVSHRKWHDARYCQTGQDLSTDVQCTEDELDNHLHGGGGDDGVVSSKTKVPNNGRSGILNDAESIDQEEFPVFIHDNKKGGIETHIESQFEDTKI